MTLNDEQFNLLQKQADKAKMNLIVLQKRDGTDYCFDCEDGRKYPLSYMVQAVIDNIGAAPNATQEENERVEAGLKALLDLTLADEGSN